MSVRTIDQEKIEAGTLNRLDDTGVERVIFMRVEIDGEKVDIAMSPMMADTLGRALVRLVNE